MTATPAPALKLADLPVDILNLIIADLNYQDRYKLHIVKFRAECGLNAPALDLSVNIDDFCGKFAAHIRKFLRGILDISDSASIFIPPDETRYKTELYAKENKIRFDQSLYNYSKQYDIRTYFKYNAKKHKDLDTIFKITYIENSVEYIYCKLAQFTVEYFTRFDDDYCNLSHKYCIIFHYYHKLFSIIQTNYCKYIGMSVYISEFKSIFDSAFLLWKHVSKIQFIDTPYILYDPYYEHEEFSKIDSKDKYHVLYKSTQFISCRSLPNLLSRYIRHGRESQTNKAVMHYNCIMQKYISGILKELNLHMYYLTESKTGIVTPQELSYLTYKKYKVLYIYDEVMMRIDMLIRTLNALPNHKITVANLNNAINEHMAKTIIDKNVNRATIVQELYGDIDIGSSHISKKERLICTAIKEYLSRPADYYELMIGAASYEDDVE